MWRSFFWSIGIFACLLGAECLVVEKALLQPSAAAAGNGSNYALRAAPSQKEIVVPDWAPWSLFSFGAVTLIYTVTLPKRANGG